MGRVKLSSKGWEEHVSGVGVGGMMVLDPIHHLGPESPTWSCLVLSQHTAAVWGSNMVREQLFSYLEEMSSFLLLTLDPV